MKTAQYFGKVHGKTVQQARLMFELIRGWLSEGEDKVVFECHSAELAQLRKENEALKRVADAAREYFDAPGNMHCPEKYTNIIQALSALEEASRE